MQDINTAAAIDAALKCNWQKAILTNGKILKEHPGDIDCLNRLGKAYLETGDHKKASFFFRKVLKLDKYNSIAQKNLDRATDTKNTKGLNLKIGACQTLSATDFLEEPGKTRLVTLVNIAPPAVLLKKDHGECLALIPKRHTVIVEDLETNYLGALPDDLGHRLSILIKGGNQYAAVVKSVTRNTFIVFLREIFRSKKFHNTPSFLTTASADYLSFLREDSENFEGAKMTATSNATNSSLDDQDEEPSSANKLHLDEEPEAS